MKKTFIASIMFVFALAIFTSGAAFAADDAQAAYEAFSQKSETLQEQLYNKQQELGALFASGQRDEAKVQALTKEIGQLEGQLLAAESELRFKLASAGVQVGNQGMYHDGNSYQGANRTAGGYNSHGGGHESYGHRGGRNW